ncbi:MAG: hypothetical protein V7641_4306 [Blastocatellia bacterium]
MTLADAIAQWLEAMARDDSVSQACAESRALSLAWLTIYFGKNRRLDELTPARLRDFLARWFIENAGLASHRANDLSSPGELPETASLMAALAEFIDWVARNRGFAAASECLAVIAELRERLPRALAISGRLSEHLAGRGGAFGFPEFLTSFEAGGHSQYDFDTAGESGCMEGYFRILRVEDGQVEAEELLTETRAWPILFPDSVAALLENDYIINMELVRAAEGWHVAACGFAYPPGTEV